ncbi:MAG: restriction endonuclease subunit S, partial [Limnospira sp. PMC 1291.21]|uniref:Type I restriction modificatio n=5 Tax=Limnospira TaxID=2596745 RepID=A0A9P1P1E7_9CYAN|nr:MULTISPECIES: restriction endonuclease subunit S [Limnospira]EKD09198.1 type I restriction modificatio [Arthrospira platensis C1]MDC0836696.1 restriction endonuclease subunit S [Limnoraphis robusta]MDY7053198.1 restriction endonuclease subunit S [Limnospira fusiformis LS22]QJB24615.1 restriction endonuclease subunit S [Limnospira fusiformis SAG 85.79]RAQ47808.1 restriction endonuclease subunit S [Arthrospira sp. O9.13F]
MSEWNIEPLGKIAVIQTGRLDSNAAVDGGIYPYFTCSPVTRSINEYSFDGDAVLLACNNANGIFSVKHYNGKFNAYQRTYVMLWSKGKSPSPTPIPNRA